MRAKVDAKEFIHALERVSGLIRKSDIPALNAVRVRFEQDRCTLTATNIDTYLSAALPAQGDAFAFLLDRPKETARAFRLFEGELVLEQTETGEGYHRQIKLALSCGSRSAEFYVFPPEDFPGYPAWEAKDSFNTSAARLYARVERVKYAVGLPCKNDKSRACRTRVQFSADRVYGVDGYRMAWDIDPELDVPRPFMAAPDALEHLKLFGGQIVSVRLGERFAEVTDGAMSLLFRLPEGELLRLENVVPDKFRQEFQVFPKEFLGELNYLKTVLRGKGPYAVRFTDGRLYAESRGERHFTAVRADGCSGVTFGFNLDYMVDALEQFKKEPSVNMKVTSSSLGPIVIEAEGRNDHAMVLPVRLKEAGRAA